MQLRTHGTFQFTTASSFSLLSQKTCSYENNNSVRKGDIHLGRFYVGQESRVVDGDKIFPFGGACEPLSPRDPGLDCPGDVALFTHHNLTTTNWFPWLVPLKGEYPINID